MKKLILLCGPFAIVIAVAVAFISLKKAEPSLLMQNIEALSQEENGESKTCFKTMSWDPNKADLTMYGHLSCNTCEPQAATSISNSSTCTK